MKKLFILAALLGVATTCFGDHHYNNGPRRDCHRGHCRHCRKDGKPVQCRHQHQCHHHHHGHHNTVEK